MPWPAAGVERSCISHRSTRGEPTAHQVAYITSKAGLLGLNRSLSTELGPLGIRSTVVNPGYVATPLTRQYVGEEMYEYMTTRFARSPQGRMATPDEIAGAILFLASDDGRHQQRRRAHGRRGRSDNLYIVETLPSAGRGVRITGIDCHVLLDPACEPEATSSAQDTIVVEVHTDEGIVGIGETDLNAWVARALIEAPATHTMDRGLGEMLIGIDPLDPVAAGEALYVGTAMTGRRGAGVHALGAIDIALWDICGKACGEPCRRLLGEQAHEALSPYASLLPQVETFDEYFDAMVGSVLEARRIGFVAAKLES